MENLEKNTQFLLNAMSFMTNCNFGCLKNVSCAYIDTFANLLFCGCEIEIIDISDFEPTITCMNELGNAIKQNSFVSSVSMQSIQRLPDLPLARSIKLMLENEKSCKKLALPYCNFKPISIGILTTAIAQSKAIEEIDLQFGKIGDFGAEHIAKSLITCRSLAVLNLSGTDITQTGVKEVINSVKVSKTLKSLSLDKLNIGPEVAQEIAMVLEKNCMLTYLSLANSKLGDQGSKVILGTLLQNCTITHLNLESNNIPYQTIDSSSEALKSNQHLIYLNFNSNVIENRGAESLANILKVNKKISHLFLNKNKIETEGACKLMQSENLEELSLDDNLIGSTGDIFEMGQELANNKSLKILSLNNNNLKSDGALAIEDALGNNMTLKIIRISGNGIDTYGAKALFNGLNKNMSVHEINLESNPIQPSGCAYITSCIRGCLALRNLNVRNCGFDFISSMNLIKKADDPLCALEQLEISNTQGLLNPANRFSQSTLANEAKVKKLKLIIH